MPNISAATAKKRRLLGNVVDSILLFGAPVWANRMSPTGKAMMAKVQRKMALMVSSAYCTVLADAAFVVASMPPIDILVIERHYMYNNKNDPEAKRKAREDTIRSWQTRCDESNKGRWTHRLNSSTDQWLNRKHGDVNYHITQFLTGHGCFPTYLHRFGKLDSPVCWYCEQANDDAHHSLFVCDAWDSRRSRLNTLCGTTVAPENIIGIMLQSKTSWQSVSAFIYEVLKKKEDEERRRQSEQDN